MGWGLFVIWIVFAGCASEPDVDRLKSDVLKIGRLDTHDGYARYISSITQIKELQIVNKQKTGNVIEYHVNMAIQFDNDSNIKKLNNELITYTKEDGKWQLRR